MDERVAVVIPCFNDGTLLLEAIASVDEAEHVELVVVDDASTEQTTTQILERLLSEGVRVVRHGANRGLSEARNTGLAATNAPYVFTLDSDDLAVAGMLARMADQLDAHPQAAVCYGDYLMFGEERIVRAVPHTLDAFRIAYVNEYPVSALFRRTVLEELGGWRTLGAGYEDWDLWMSLAERGLQGTFMGAAVVTSRKRVQGGRMLAHAKREHRELYRMMESGHPRLFSEMRKHRRESDLTFVRKLLYPIVYGGRRRFAFELGIRRLLDQAGIWTLRR